MDPIARKNINENIVKNKNTKNTIFYCTHIIDEAEFVADRIAIMINGKIKALDTPMRLKNKYGNEYMLWITLDNSDVQVDQEFKEKEKEKQIQNKKIEELFEQVFIDQKDTITYNSFEATKTKILSINKYLENVLENF
eukprot:CAMPEP_0116935254 /NCGR_PEP_ID=MMETSP0467-20121206/30155_1 /TAXON_ID=283647 /ORGANISM="Mesodinium pulex, Strain SPMC105" /LENGTH=137 /DNA_ID=CAMNT_0004616555 /DNA_START=827 /DNA_END=1240 /DNA_ORIENTATION=+